MVDTEEDKDVRGKVRGFLSRFFKNRELADDDDIFELGFVNSLVAMQLVQFVEKEFSLTVEDDDLDLDNFRSIDSIAGLVESKRTAPAAAD